MPRIKLNVADSHAAISIDSSVIGYDRDETDGVDLLCGHCENIVFPSFSVNNSGRGIRIRGVQCPSCGGGNILDTDSIRPVA